MAKTVGFLVSNYLILYTNVCLDVIGNLCALPHWFSVCVLLKMCVHGSYYFWNMLLGL